MGALALSGLDLRTVSSDTHSMTVMPLHLFVGWAVVYAVVGTAVAAVIGLLTELRLRGRLLLTLFVVLFFVALTQHPFPDPEALQCPVPQARPNLVPFDFLRLFAREWQRSQELGAWLRSTSAVAYAMNLLLCTLVGATLPAHGLRLHAALLLGVGLSLNVELTQLTGAWGLYPCAYRKFDVDDLILNTLGVALGFRLASRWMRR